MGVPLHTELTSLCPRPGYILGIIAMILIILGILLHTANLIVNRGKPKTSKKTLLWLAGTSILALALLSIVLYIITPPLITLLLYNGDALGADQLNDPCNPSVPPYCGQDFCERNNWTVPAGLNCTCLQG